MRLNTIFSVIPSKLGDIIGARNWHDERTAIIGTVGAIESAREWSGRVQVYCPVEHMSTINGMLDVKGTRRIEDHGADLWALGKIQAYRGAADNFIHLDMDTFTERFMDFNISKGDIVTQLREDGDVPRDVYYPLVREINRALPHRKRLPFVSYVNTMSVFAVVDQAAFVDEYTSRAIELAHVVKDLCDGDQDRAGMFAIIYEQYLERVVSMEMGLDGNHKYLDPNSGGPKLQGGKFIHYWGTKKDPNIAAGIQKHIIQKYPSEVHRALTVMGKWTTAQDKAQPLTAPGPIQICEKDFHFPKRTHY